MVGNGENHEQQIPYDVWKHDFMHAVREIERENPPDSINSEIGAFATATRAAMNTVQFEETVKAVYYREDVVEGENAVNLLLRVYQGDQLDRTPWYPAGFNDPERWILAFQEVDMDPYRWGLLYSNLMTKQVQTNIAERYKSAQLLASLMTDRFDGQPSHLDVGSSVLHGDIKLVFGNDPTNDCPPFTPAEILTEARLNAPIDQRLTALANFAISQNITFGEVVGVDMTNVDDPIVAGWAAKCLKPAEYRDPRVLEEYKLLDRIDPQHERVKFIRTDFSNPKDFKKFRDASPIDKYDIITFSTTLYMVNKQERSAMLRHARKVLSDRGIIIIQDFPGGRSSEKFNYLTEVIDSEKSKYDRHLIMRWYDGRCNQAALEAGRIIFDSGEMSLEDALGSKDHSVKSA